MRTNLDELARIMAPAVQATVPGASLRRRQRIDAAVDESGNIRAGALLFAGSATRFDLDVASHTASSSDTVDPAEYLAAELIHLPQGVWLLLGVGMICGRLSGASSLNGYTEINGQQSTNYQIPLAAGDMGVVWSKLVATVSGDVLLRTLFRPSAGTATIESGGWMYYARRTP